MDELRPRLFAALAALASVLAFGTVGYWVVGRGQWGMADCLYMTVTTLATVGYGEILPDFAHTPYARAFTILLIVLGVGAVLYFITTFAAFIIEGDLQKAVRHTRMRKKISKLEGHVVVCGAGSTGRHTLEELTQLHVPCVAIDIDGERLDALADEFRSDHFHTLVGDATDDHVLVAANIAKAKGIVVATANDKDNLFVTVTARQANPNARIVSRGSDLRVLEKLRKAGADTVVSPNYIGGLRMASELLRPQVVRFMDEMRKDEQQMRIEEVEVPRGSGYIGKSLASSGIRADNDVLVLAVVDAEHKGYSYNPSAEYELKAGTTLVVMGPFAKVTALRERMAE